MTRRDALAACLLLAREGDMPGAKVHISRKTVIALKRGDWITDDALPGFKVRRPNRLALYGLNIRLQGRMRWISIGSEADLTPDQARAEAERLRGLKRQGIDPANERDRRKAGITIAAAWARFMREHVRPKLKGRTVDQYEEMIARLMLPRFGTWRLDSVTTADVGQWHSELADKPVQANRVLAILSSLMSWAVRQKLRDGNPCAGIARYRERQVNRYPTAQEIGRLAQAVDELEREGRLDPLFAAGVKILMMTGARRSEIFEAQWSWLDVERRSLVLPDSKTGAKVIALPEAALAIILALPRFAGCKWIFPSPKTERPVVGFKSQWRRVLDRAGVGSWRLHDLRHGFASAAVMAGAPLYVVGRQLGHAKPATTGRYAHVADAPKHQVVEMVAGLLINPVRNHDG
jgi:integrase